MIIEEIIVGIIDKTYIVDCILRFFATFETAKSSVMSSASSLRHNAITETSSTESSCKSPDLFAAFLTISINSDSGLEIVNLPVSIKISTAS